MKNNKLLSNSIFLVMFFAGLFPYRASAQQIPNAGFENWSQFSFFEDPLGYTTTNFQAYLTLGQANVTKTPDAHSGSYAVKLESVGAGADILPGGIFLGSPGPFGVNGGFPFTGTPDSISMYLKYELLPLDTAMFVFFFQFMGNPLGMAFYSVYGTQTDYSRVVFPVEWFVPGLSPDTVAMIAFSSQPDMASAAGSVLFIDDIFFTGTTQQLPNHGFETWTDMASLEPDQWFSSNIFSITATGLSVTRDPDNVAGLYSAKLTNMIGIGGDTLSYLTNGFIGSNGPSGGTPIFQNPDKITFYYKYTPVGNDTALALGMLFLHNPFSGPPLQCDSVMVKLPSTSTWTFAEIDFAYTGPSADTVLFAVAGGNIEGAAGSAQPGSMLWIDEVEIQYPVGIKHMTSTKPRVFPNPAGDCLGMTLPGEGVLAIEILAANGQPVASFVPGNPAQVQKLGVNHLPAGLYLYRIITRQGTYSGKFTKI